MKTLILSILLCALSSNLFGQSADSIISQSESIVLLKNTDSGRFTLIHKKRNQKLENLKFAKRIFRYFQVLDATNNMFYIGDDWEKKETVEDFIGVCGTVPHFSLTVQTRGAYFEILEDETFYDRNNVPAEVKFKVNKHEADSVVFINGKNSFSFDSNFGIGFPTINPRTLILIKNGKYFTRDHPHLKYDSIGFMSSYYDHKPSLSTMKNNLYGLLGIVEPKYKRIEAFRHYLAEAETVDGTLVFIDAEGNEY